MDGMTNGRAMAGFTLTELIVVMLIVGIIAAIGMPSFKSVTTSNRITSEVNGLLGDMQYARSMAIKEGLPVTVCSSTDASTCNGGPLWQGGWIVFLDSNSDQQRQPSETIVRVQRAFASSDSFVPDNGSFNAITFNREGYASTNWPSLVTLILHDSTANAAWTRCLAITPLGMLNTQRHGPAAPSCT
jgi:type IV fimbrial biogenesis protein FimT